jgi:D-amino-acid dehydrogenase
MKIAVLGAGVIGTTTAYELARDGHQVAVFDRHSAAAEECSFANAGVLAPGYVTPWAAPGMPTKVLRHLLSRHGPVRLSLPLSLADLGWMWHWLRACRTSVYQVNRARMQSLAHYSQERLLELTSSLQLEYESSQGYLVLQRSAREQRQAQPGMQVLRDAGVKFAELSPEQARLIEPALSTDTPLHGAIHLPSDGVANCRQFALLLKGQAQRLGAQFHFGTEVRRLKSDHGVLVWTGANPQSQRFDAVVVCAGADSTRLLQPLQIRIPLIAVYGYSVSAPVREDLNAPRSGIMDERYKVAITRLGQRVRVAGSAEIGGSLHSSKASALSTLYKVLQDWFPGAAQFSAGVQEWKGARPMMPDGPPIVGPSGVPGVWLNLGHGSSGWALSCGSARITADLIAQRQPEVSADGLGLSRLRRA